MEYNLRKSDNITIEIVDVLGKNSNAEIGLGYTSVLNYIIDIFPK